ncbi:MAG TPA: hypothetical protein VIW69_01615 [Candidatus Elarobacter sp.]
MRFGMPGGARDVSVAGSSRTSGHTVMNCASAANSAPVPSSN